MSNNKKLVDWTEAEFYAVKHLLEDNVEYKDIVIEINATFHNGEAVRSESACRYQGDKDVYVAPKQPKGAAPAPVPVVAPKPKACPFANASFEDDERAAQCKTRISGIISTPSYGNSMEIV